MSGGIKVNFADGMHELELTLMCDKFHKLPSEVLAQDAYLMRRVFAISEELDRIRNMRRRK